MVLRNGMYLGLESRDGSDRVWRFEPAYSAVQETNEESPSEPENTEEADATEEDAGAESKKVGKRSTSDIEEARKRIPRRTLGG